MRYSGLGVRSVGPVGNFLEFGIFSWSNLWKMSFKSTTKKTFKGPIARKITWFFLQERHPKKTETKNLGKSQRQDSPSCLPLQSVLSLKKKTFVSLGTCCLHPNRKTNFIENRNAQIFLDFVCAVFFQEWRTKTSWWFQLIWKIYSSNWIHLP